MGPQRSASTAGPSRDAALDAAASSWFMFSRRRDDRDAAQPTGKPTCLQLSRPERPVRYPQGNMNRSIRRHDVTGPTRSPWLQTSPPDREHDAAWSRRGAKPISIVAAAGFEHAQRFHGGTERIGRSVDHYTVCLGYVGTGSRMAQQ
jgi:hypothetical protein